MPFSDLINTYPAVWPAFALLLGLLVGSFLNVVIYRLPQMMEANWRAECQALLYGSEPRNDSVATSVTTSPDGLQASGSPDQGNPSGFNLAVPSSHCPQCQAPIKAWQNIPLLSYMLLRGRCKHCRNPIGLRYPLVELTAGLLAFTVAWQLGWGVQAAAAIVITWALLTLTVIDIDHQLLPDQITLPLLWLGLLINTNGVFVSLIDAVWGAAAGYLVLWCVYWLFKLVTGKEGMGYGDFKLLAVLGAWLGWQQLALIVVLSSVVGAVIGSLLLVVQGRDRATPIPFGPYLAIAGWIALLWGDILIGSYLQFAGLGVPVGY